VNDKYGDKEIDIDLKDNNALRDFMSEMLPEYDEERVYASDIKKIVKWYNLLLENDILDFTEVEAEAKADDEVEEEKTIEEKPGPKKSSPKSAPKADAKKQATDDEEK